MGYELAKEYVAAQFERIGLERYDRASYVQPFELLEATEDLGSALEIGQLDVREPDARFAPAWLEGEARWEGEGLFLGYGLATHGRDDYEGAEVRGKAVFLLAGEPPEWSEDRDRARAAAAKAEIATRKGATMVIELTLPPGGDEEAAPQSPWPRRQLALADGTSPRDPPSRHRPAGRFRKAPGFLGCRSGSGASLGGRGQRPTSSGGLATHRPQARHRAGSELERRGRRARVRIQQAATSPSSLRRTSITWGIGPPDAKGDRIANGAHDNGLGSAKILAAAEAMARLRPRRSIVFAAVGAEERSLLGSWYYVRNAALPIEKVVANINVDGGREGVATEDVIANAADVSELEAIVREVMATRDVGVMDRDRASRNQVGFSSDHYSFLLAGVPAVDLKPGHTVEGDMEIGLQDRRRYYRELRHRPADNFDEDQFTLESAAEMAKRSLWLAWHLSETPAMPGIKPGQALWRERGRPDQPFYFGKSDAFAH